MKLSFFDIQGIEMEEVHETSVNDETRNDSANLCVTFFNLFLFFLFVMILVG